MAIELVTQYSPYVDEIFTKESKIDILTNKDYRFTGAKTVKVYKVSTSKMNDYARNGGNTSWSRYGEIKDLDATTEDMTLKKDRSFTFVTKTPPAAVLIKKACGIESGSGVPNKTKVAKITREQVKKIAEQKMPDLNAANIESAMRMVAGTARSMGVEVVD